MTDTIFALATGTLPCAIAIVRVSGPAARGSFAALGVAVPTPRHATRVTLRDRGGVVDDALTLWFPGPASATGEDVAEFHVHGSRAVVAAVADALATVAGLRPALAGEFTRQAFDNGIVDLTQVEALGTLLSAETVAQRRAAMTGLSGGLRDCITRIEARLDDIAARVEASLDLGDEDDVGKDPAAAADLVMLREAIGKVLAAPPAERLHDGVRVVLSGAPNTGKSSLLNALVGRDAAIVADQPGTTRDLVEVPVMIDGVPIVFVDTAGLRMADDAVEAIGVERARGAFASADIILALDDHNRADPRALAIAAKCDVADGDGHRCSARDGTGMTELRARLFKAAGTMLPATAAPLANVRQRDALVSAFDAVERAVSIDDPICVAADLQLARHALATITGRGDTETLLDSIFSRFCVGK